MIDSPYALDDMVREGKKLRELTGDELADLIHDGRLTPAMFNAVQDEYIYRLKAVDHASR